MIFVIIGDLRLRQVCHNI